MIHPTAIVDPEATIADDVTIGPWTWIGPNVCIGKGSVIHSHVVIKGPTRIGCHNEIFQFATIGEKTTDLKYQDEPTRLEIGDHNVIREGVTIHRGTIQDRALTSIGNHNLIMAYAHIGHDCIVHNHTIFVNNASVAGHVEVCDYAILGGYTLVHQNCRIGEYAFTGMATGVGKDVPAFVMVSGTPAAKAYNINAEGLKRRGFARETIRDLREAFKIIYRRGHTVAEAIEQLKVLAQQTPDVQLMVHSLEQTKRGITR